MSPLPPSIPVWFISGCSSGLGLALAREVASAGIGVAATARDVAALGSLQQEFPDLVLPLAMDLNNPASISAAAAAVLDQFGKVDVLVNNAGCGVVGALEEQSEVQIRQNMETNFFGPTRLIRTLLPSFRAQGSGHIVNISAAAAISNYPGFSIYGAGKCAMEGLSEALALELKPLGIHIMIVQPGPFRTDFVGRSLASATNSFPEYEATSGRFANLIRTMNGKQPGDPAKAAAAIIEAVNSPSPPLRLVLGRYAIDKVKKKIASTTQELAAWENVGAATQF